MILFVLFCCRSSCGFIELRECDLSGGPACVPHFFLYKGFVDLWESRLLSSSESNATGRRTWQAFAFPLIDLFLASRGAVLQTEGGCPHYAVFCLSPRCPLPSLLHPILPPPDLSSANVRASFGRLCYSFASSFLFF